MKILYLPNSHCQQRQFEKPNFTAYPVLLAMEAEWYRREGHIVDWDTCKYPMYDKVITEPEGLDFLTLPKPDRVFTEAMDKKYQNNGNFKYLPGTYIQSANGCWWGNCSFCVEKNKPYLVRPVDSVIEEINECKKIGIREVFDDSGTFPTGAWLDNFCNRLNTIKSLNFSCNMRLVDIDYTLLRRSGFRMVLFGIESANQITLDRINKGTKTEDIKYVIKAAKAGIDCHGAFMFGYPWETDEDAIRTLRLCHWLLRKGYLKTSQASFYNIGDGKGKEQHRKYIRKIYGVWKSPEFWFNKIRDIHNVDDLKYLWRAIKKGLTHD